MHFKLQMRWLGGPQMTSVACDAYRDCVWWVGFNPLRRDQNDASIGNSGNGIRGAATGG